MLGKKSKILKLFIAASSSLFAVPQRLESVIDISELRVKFVRSGRPMGEVIYSGPGAIILRERLECSPKEIVDLWAIWDLSNGLTRMRRVSWGKKFKMINNCFRGAKIIEVIDLKSRKLDLLLALHGFDRKIPQSLMEEIIDYAVDELPLGMSVLTLNSDIIAAASIGVRDVYIFALSLLVYLALLQFDIDLTNEDRNSWIWHQLNWIWVCGLAPSRIPYKVNFLQSHCCFILITAQVYAIFKPIKCVVQRCFNFNEALNPSWKFYLHYLFCCGPDSYGSDNIQIRSVL